MEKRSPKGSSKRGPSRRGSKEEHDRIVRETLLLLSKEAHRIGRFFNNPTGVAYRDHDWGREWIQYGIPGSPDIYGFIGGGFYIGIEIKSGQAVQQDNQRQFERIVKHFDGHYFVAHSAQEALDFVIRAATSSRLGRE